MYRLPVVLFIAFAATPCPAADPIQKVIPGWGTAVDPDGDCQNRPGLEE